MKIFSQVKFSSLNGSYVVVTLIQIDVDSYSSQVKILGKDLFTKQSYKKENEIMGLLTSWYSQEHMSICFYPSCKETLKVES